MKATIKISKAAGSVSAPPSKSMAHRLLICAALSGSKCRIDNIAKSEDILATLDCLKELGSEFQFNNGSVDLSGINPFKISGKITAHCRESGSTLRFMIPIFLLTGADVTLTGSKYLLSRPLKIYEDICKSNGFLYEQSADSLHICGKLKAGEYKIPGNISSQFISGLLFALPLLTADSDIYITGKFESRSYIDLTLSALKIFGINIEWVGENRLHISGNQKYIPHNTVTEGDYSNAAFLEALNFLGGDVTVTGLNPNSLQGDKVYFDYFNAIKSGNSSLDITNCPDLAPILFAMAANFGGAEFTGTARLKMKESDRAAVMAEELKKFGAELEIFDNSVIVKNNTLHSPSIVLFGHNDHRIVMALSVLLTRFGGQIDGAEAINKSFPDFFDYLTQLGIEVSLNAD